MLDNDKRVSEVAQSFQALARAQDESLALDIAPMLSFTGDEKALIAAPGIGKKIAQRIIYNTPVSPLPICVASLILCDSPPESVEAERESVR